MVFSTQATSTSGKKQWTSALQYVPEISPSRRWADRFGISFVLSRRAVIMVLAGSPWLIVQGCTLIRDQAFYQTSPDGKKKLIVGTYGIKPQLKIFLKDGFRSRELHFVLGEWYTGFLQMYWSPNSKVCGLWIAALGSVNGLLSAFDANSGSQVDPRAVRDPIRAAIIERYKLQNRIASNPKFDPFAWSLTREAQIAFSESELGQGEK